MERVYEIYIKTTPERLWQAITDPEMRRKYTFGVGVYSDWKPGSPYRGVAGDVADHRVVARAFGDERDRLGLVRHGAVGHGSRILRDGSREDRLGLRRHGEVLRLR